MGQVAQFRWFRCREDKRGIIEAFWETNFSCSSCFEQWRRQRARTKTGRPVGGAGLGRLDRSCDKLARRGALARQQDVEQLIEGSVCGPEVLRVERRYINQVSGAAKVSQRAPAVRLGSANSEPLARTLEMKLSHLEIQFSHRHPAGLLDALLEAKLGDHFVN